MTNNNPEITTQDQLNKIFAESFIEAGAAISDLRAETNALELVARALLGNLKNLHKQEDAELIIRQLVVRVAPAVALEKCPENQEYFLSIVERVCGLGDPPDNVVDLFSGDKDKDR